MHPSAVRSLSVPISTLLLTSPLRNFPRSSSRSPGPGTGAWSPRCSGSTRKPSPASEKPSPRNGNRLASVDPPSRVVAVSTVLTQALLRADTIKHGRQRASLIAQAINVRGRTVPPVSEHSCGTWVSLSYLEFDERESRAMAMASSLPAMAMKVRESSIQGVRDCARILSDKEFGRRVLVDTYFEAAEKADGPDYKVVWVSLCDVPLKDMFILMNTKDNEGIEAWVYLHESDMVFREG